MLMKSLKLLLENMDHDFLQSTFRVGQSNLKRDKYIGNIIFNVACINSTVFNARCVFFLQLIATLPTLLLFLSDNLYL